MNHQEATSIAHRDLLPLVCERYGLAGYAIQPVEAHEGGRNLVYVCDMEGAASRILRISFLEDRTREDMLAEVEFIRYLAAHGAPVADVIPSRTGMLVEEVPHGANLFRICLFEKGTGKGLAENNYRYRDGAPLTEYFHACGKVLGQIHRLSKSFRPVHRRYDFFDQYNAETIDRTIPASLPRLRTKLKELVHTLGALERTDDNYGMVHFDYSDGNYTIDFETGRFTVYDFDNACTCWYLFDLANVWTHGVGWVQFEPDAAKRRTYMEKYFEVVLQGYRSETDIDPAMLDRLPLMIQAVTMENIMDAFTVMRNQGEALACDESLSYLIRCMENDIPYQGFFHEIYSAEEPFEAEPIAL